MSAALLVVLGAVNIDLVVRGVPLPRPGETVLGGSFERHQGGKGGNQAVAAARALCGGPAESAVRFVGAVGDDPMGAEALEALRNEGVDVSHVSVAPQSATGVALIVVDDAGENQIAVAPGANATLIPDDIETGLEGVGPGSVLLISLEVPLDVVRRAAERARELGGTVVLNPAPAAAEAKALLDVADVITPNQRELSVLGHDAESIRSAHPGLRVVLTLGERGAEIDGFIAVPAPKVRAVDTTGAGDTANGVLAASLLEGRPLEEAARRAVAAASASVTQAGAREGMPLRKEIDSASAG
ncbi:MAG: ribokinase [Actinomycetota bacterium]